MKMLSRSISLWLVNALVMVAMLPNLVKTVSALETNLTLRNGLGSLGDIHAEQISQLYWNLDRHPPVNLDTFQLSSSSMTPGKVLYQTVYHSLQQDYGAVADLAETFSELCITRPTCSLLAGKAMWMLGRYDAVGRYWSEEDMWQTLVARAPVVPKDEIELQRFRQYYEVLRNIHPERPEAHFALGTVNRSFGRWQESVGYFEQALLLSPHHPRYQCALGEALVVTGRDVVGGVALCEEALRFAPNDLWLYYQAGVTLVKAGNCVRASAIFQAAREAFSSREEPGKWWEEYRQGLIGKCASVN